MQTFNCHRAKGDKRVERKENKQRNAQVAQGLLSYCLVEQQVARTADKQPTGLHEITELGVVPLQIQREITQGRNNRIFATFPQNGCRPPNPAKAKSTAWDG